MDYAFFIIQSFLLFIALIFGLLLFSRWRFKKSLKIKKIKFKFFDKAVLFWHHIADLKVKEIPAWNSDLEDYNQLSIDAYKVIFDQARERFMQAVTESETITKRSLILLSLYVTTLSAVLGFYFSLPKENENPPAQVIIILSFLAIGMSIYSFIVLFQLISPKAVILPGSPPAELLYKEAFEDVKVEETEIVVYYNEICRYQSRITYMKEYNEIRMARYNYVLKVSLLIILSAISILLGSV